MDKAQDAMKAASKVYRLLMENEKVRVMDLQLRPGEKAPMHNHPSKHVVYVISDTKLRLTSPDGKSSELDLKAGQTVWMEAESHEAANIGKTDGHLLVVEVKK